MMIKWFDIDKHAGQKKEQKKTINNNEPLIIINQKKINK